MNVNEDSIKEGEEENNNDNDNSTNIYEIVNPNKPEEILTYDDNTLRILEDIIDINDPQQLGNELAIIQQEIIENNNKLEQENDNVEDTTIPLILTNENNDIILADNVEEDKIPQILEEIKDKAMEEEIEIHKDEKEPDRNIIPPRPPRENRNTIKQWIDKNRDNSKRKHQLEDTNEYQEKRDFERGIHLEELQQYLPLEEKEEREEAINRNKNKKLPK
ncbi:Hypothetical protein EHI5A_262500 [Entamoeba histolytica KU27]|uniref:Uncharacterized protein n=1 Tax=Entamoeba histolytica KU27 TaxID=885311 RepID=M2QB51_ENTHI|nr:Hypothetical protein EHI5A_262500 [Entamoeba histolytica KU27]